MKKVTLTIASILLSGLLIAQDYTPPQSATASLTKKYPKAMVDEWADDETEIVCYFETEGIYGSASFSPKGVWIRSEFSLNDDELPENILASIKGEYNGFEMTGITKREDVKQVTYEVSVYNNTTEEDFLITLDTNGKIIKEEDLNADY